MADPLYFTSMVLQAKIESVYGTDPTPTQCLLATDVTVRPMEGEDVPRQIVRPFFGAFEQLPANTHIAIEFDIELVGGGTAGVAAAWGPLMRACACAETIVADTSVAYTRVSTAHESVALYFFIGGNRQKILGARGNAELRVNAQGIPKIHFSFLGLYAKPAATATPSLDLSAFKTPLIANKVNTPVFTVNAVSLVARSITFNLGNDVKPRLLIGREEIVIQNSAENLTAQVEAVALATLDPFALAAAQTNGTITKVAAALTQDTRTGHKAALACATCQIMRPAGYDDDENVVMWNLNLTPLPSSTGNDQFSLTLT